MEKLKVKMPDEKRKLFEYKEVDFPYYSANILWTYKVLSYSKTIAVRHSEYGYSIEVRPHLIELAVDLSESRPITEEQFWKSYNEIKDKLYAAAISG